MCLDGNLESRRLANLPAFTAPLSIEHITRIRFMSDRSPLLFLITGKKVILKSNQIMLYPGDLYVQRGQEDYENQRGQGITKYPGDPKRLRRFKRIRGSEDLKESGGPERYWRIRGIQGDSRNTR